MSLKKYIVSVYIGCSFHYSVLYSFPGIVIIRKNEFRRVVKNENKTNNIKALFQIDVSEHFNKNLKNNILF